MKVELHAVDAIILLTASTVLILGCLQPSEEIQKLQSVEVRNYEGKDLSSIADLPENSIKGPQYVNIANYSLMVYGLVEHPRNYTYDEVLSRNRYSKVVTLNCVEGWSVDILWEGVLVNDLFDDAGVLDSANTVILYAYDGYSTSFPISYIRDNRIMLAYQMNNVTLPAERGFPFQLVAEDKWGYKWIKWITKIELSNDSSYEGYWEQRGYSQFGDLGKSKFV
ncbi:MAG: molybdopterin-dependent oxidoreductase [Candidatus Altiarchaeota archaeon]|nr:molybdopterin-dependent oxidoreductase [Candidatus Altiarchaeota archaeon]